jgi:hypothetical protein
MDAAAREREIERAWRRHDPDRAKVPPRARRAVQAFKERIAPDAAKIKAAYSSTSFRQTVNDWARKKGVGRERALHKIKAAMAPAAVEDAFGALRLTWLESRGQMVLADHPSFRQNCILIVAARISRAGRDVRESGSPALEVPDHALGRMFQRAPSIDASAALHEAACAFWPPIIVPSRSCARGARRCACRPAPGCSWPRPSARPISRIKFGFLAAGQLGSATTWPSPISNPSEPRLTPEPPYWRRLRHERSALPECAATRRE